MADMISILIFIIFCYFVAKKLIIPTVSARVAAKRAAKNLPPVEVSVSDSASGMAAIQAAVQATAGGRSVTCFDMRIIHTPAPDDDTGEDDDITFTHRVTYAANEMLLNASTRGDAVRLNAVFIRPYALMLYVTYAVR